MRPEQGFANRTRVIKMKGHGKGRRGLIKEVHLQSGTWEVLFDDTLLADTVNPYEFEREEAGAKLLQKN